MTKYWWILLQYSPQRMLHVHRGHGFCKCRRWTWAHNGCCMSILVICRHPFTHICLSVSLSHTKHTLTYACIGSRGSILALAGRMSSEYSDKFWAELVRRADKCALTASDWFKEKNSILLVKVVPVVASQERCYTWKRTIQCPWLFTHARTCI